MKKKEQFSIKGIKTKLDKNLVLVMVGIRKGNMKNGERGTFRNYFST